MDVIHEKKGAMSLSLSLEEINRLRTGLDCTAAEPAQSGLIPFVVGAEAGMGRIATALLYPHNYLGVYIPPEFLTDEHSTDSILGGVPLTVIKRENIRTSEEVRKPGHFFGKTGHIAISANTDLSRVLA